MNRWKNTKMRITRVAAPLFAVTFVACASSTPSTSEAPEAAPVGPYTLGEEKPATDGDDAPLVPDVELADVPDGDGQVIAVEGEAAVEAPTVRRVLFAEDQWTIGPVGDATIVTAARHIKAHGKARVELVGHADDAIEDREAILARRRADAVLERLVEEGVKRSRIQVIAAKADTSDRHDVQIRVYAPAPIAASDVEQVEPEKLR